LEEHDFRRKGGKREKLPHFFWGEREDVNPKKGLRAFREVKERGKE